jgi:hypothetical protein
MSYACPGQALFSRIFSRLLMRFSSAIRIMGEVNAHQGVVKE